MELSFGQRIDPENNLVECWFTHGALDWIKSQDLKGKNILMVTLTYKSMFWWDCTLLIITTL